MTEWPDIAAAYDTVAEDYAATYDDELTRKPFDRDLLDRFAGVTGPGPVWDVGCGPGHVGDHLAKRGVTVTGLDLSGRTLAIARRLRPGLTFVQGDMLALPVREDCLAGIVAFYSLIHLPRGSVPAALAGMRRALRPGGSALIAVHVGEGEAHSAEWFGHQVSVTATFFGEKELPEMVSGAGLQVTDVAARPPYDFEYQTRRLYVHAERT